MYDRSFSVAIPSSLGASSAHTFDVMRPGGDRHFELTAWQALPFATAYAVTSTYSGLYVYPLLVIANGAKSLAEIQQQTSGLPDIGRSDILMGIPLAGKGSVLVPDLEDQLTIGSLYTPSGSPNVVVVTIRIREIKR